MKSFFSDFEKKNNGPGYLGHHLWTFMRGSSSEKTKEIIELIIWLPLTSKLGEKLSKLKLLNNKFMIIRVSCEKLMKNNVLNFNFSYMTITCT